MSIDVHGPLSTLEWVDRGLLIPNDYNPNKVLRDNLILLTISIIVNGFTMPLVTRPDNRIIDGFHRYLISGPDWDYIPTFSKEFNLKPEYRGKTLYEILGGKVPRVIVDQTDEDNYVFGTITHNRARGQHLLEPMKKIIKNLIDKGKSIDEICTQLGMKKEEVFRLSDFSREDFLRMLASNKEYSKARIIMKY